MRTRFQAFDPRGRGTVSVMAIVVALGVLGGSSNVPDAIELAQFGAVTKQQKTPDPRQTPAGDVGQRRQDAERPQSPFGAIRK